MLTSIPHRLREAVFRKYEHAITTAVKQFPLAITINTAMPNNEACRLREAIKSYQLYDWQPTKIERIKFDTVVASLVVREHEDKIALGGREQTKLGTSNAILPEMSCSIFEQDNNEAYVFDVSNPGLPLLCDLSAKRKLNCPVCLLGLSELLVRDLQKQYDIVLDKQPNGSYLMT